MKDPATLYLVDGSALAYRSHFAFLRNPLLTKKGELVSAIYGFTNSLLRLLEIGKPTHVVVVFDSGEPNFRHEKYPKYKATREKMPQELVGQLAGIDEVIAALRIPVLRIPRCEADDVIGTLARRAEAQGFDVRIISGDKDFFQLVNDRIQILQLARGETGELLGPASVHEKFGVGPEQIVDLLALMGDSSDNVPGVPRVGPKTATDLLQRFPSLEEIYAHLAEVKPPGVQATLEKNRALAFLSQELVTLRTDLPLPTDLQDLVWPGPDPEQTRRLFHRYEFLSLLDRIKLPAAEEAGKVAVRYRTIRTVAELEALAAELRGTALVVVDTETTGLDPLRAGLVGLSVAHRTGEAAYVPVTPPRGLFGSGGDALGLDQVRRVLGPVLADPEIRKAGQNVKYDQHVLRRAGLPLRGIAFDTMIAHYCIEPSAASHSLDALALQYFNYQKIGTRELIGRGKSQLNMAEIPLEQLSEYACEDADFTFRLVEPLRRGLEERAVLSLFEEIELPLVEVLGAMEEAGVALDTDSLHRMRERFEKRGAELEKEIHEHAGETFNVNSPRQLADVLYAKLKVHEQLGIKRVPRTQTGMSTSAAALQAMEEHPLVRLVLEYRQLEKLRGTYVDALPRLVNPETGRIHTSFNQAVAATGRLSSSDPNLQNIPIRTALGREIRRAFRSSFDAGTLISADYSQVELRIMAHLSGDARLGEAFQRNEDVHRRTAALIFRVAPEAVDDSMRTRAKTINFGIMYGMGPQRLARETGLSFREAQDFIQRYFEVFAGVKRYLDETLVQARQKGYVTTLLGRRRYIPELLSEDGRVQANAQNIAVNTPIQGTAADLIKKAMILVHDALRQQELRSRMILQVHDELVFDVAPGESGAVSGLVKRLMESALPLGVPLRVDLGEGPTWLDAHA